MNGIKIDGEGGEGDGEKKPEDDLNDTKVDKNEKAEKEKKRQAFRGKLCAYFFSY